MLVELVFTLKEICNIALRNDLSLNVQHCENLWIELETKKENLILAVIYRHPDQLSKTSFVIR